MYSHKVLILEEADNGRIMLFHLHTNGAYETCSWHKEYKEESRRLIMKNTSLTFDAIDDLCRPFARLLSLNMTTTTIEAGDDNVVACYDLWQGLVEGHTELYENKEGPNCLYEAQIACSSKHQVRPEIHPQSCSGWW